MKLAKVQKRVLFAVNELDFFLSHRSEIANSLSMEGCDVTVVALWHSGFIKPSATLRSNIKIILCRDSVGISATSVFTIFGKLKQTINEISPNLIYLISPIMHLLFGLFIRNSQITRVFVFAGLGRAFGRSWLGRVVYPFVWIFYKVALNTDRRFAIFQKKEDYEFIQKTFSVRFDKVAIIPGSGVSKHFFRVNSAKEKIRVGMASRLLIEKGVLDFIQAATLVQRTYPEIEFVLAGQMDKGWGSGLNNFLISRALKNSSVRYVGVVSEMHVFLNSLSMFVYPSNYMEGIPKVLLEAAACGVPIIASDKPGCRDVVGRSNQDCLAVVGNVCDLRDKIIYLLDRPKRMLKISMDNAERANELYRVEDVVESFIKFNDSLLETGFECEKQEDGIDCA